MTEPDLLSRCCEAPVREGQGLCWGGVAHVHICTRCERECHAVRVWNSLPAPGTFEAPIGKTYLSA